MRECASRRACPELVEGTCGCICCCLFVSTTHKSSFRPEAAHFAAGAEKSASLPKLSPSPILPRCSCLTPPPLAPPPVTPPDRSPSPPSANEPAPPRAPDSAAHDNSRGKPPDADSKPPHLPAPTASSETPKTQTPSAAAPRHPS